MIEGIRNDRIKYLNDKKINNKGKWILYWMQSSQRAEYNHALEYALLRANERNQPLLVYFHFIPYPEAHDRHFIFMLEGLKELKSNLSKRGIGFGSRKSEVGCQEKHEEKASDKNHNNRDFLSLPSDLVEKASLVVTDRGYTRFQKQWRNKIAEEINCPLIQVESDVIIPVETVSPKQEFAARTIRPKIHKLLDYYIKPLQQEEVKRESLSLADSIDFLDIENKIIKLLDIPPLFPMPDFKAESHIQPMMSKVLLGGGRSHAERHLNDFIQNKLDKYPELRNEPCLDYLSNMSPYLHFGQISPLEIALMVSKTQSPGKEKYLEELIVRRELSMNFVHYNPYYDSFDGLPDWCKKTLKEHEKDKREYIYSTSQLEQAKTHDIYWNTAQIEMMKTGKMNNYMRMYWGKKILEWTEKPEEAHKIALYLNNKYNLDGRDPNGFTGVSWCLGLHDRPWKERDIFGTIRYMNQEGLKRKFDMDSYIKKVKELS